MNLIQDPKLAFRVEPALRPLLLAVLKQAIKADAEAIRAARRGIRADQIAYGPGAAASHQSTLVMQRLKARARLLLYGFLRGRTWQQMEPKHAEPLEKRLPWAMQQVWKEAQAGMLVHAGQLGELPAQVLP